MTNIEEIIKRAKQTAQFIQENRRPPRFVQIGEQKISPASFNRLISAVIVELNAGRDTDIPIIPIAEANEPRQSLKNGKIPRSEYVNLALLANTFAYDKKRWANYVRSSLGKISPSQYMDIYCRILNFYSDKNRLPKYVYTSSLNVLQENLEKYIQETRNTNMGNQTIQRLARKYSTAKRAFIFVRDEIRHQFYHNTRKGALKTYKDRAGNCCDQSHLLIALLRLNGVPCRYKHVRARYPRITIGHVFVEANIGGQWLDLDPSHSVNGFGKIRAWTLVRFNNVFRELPF